MVKVVTSITIEEWLKEELEHEGLNISDLANTLFSAWFRSLKQKGNVVERSVKKTTDIQQLRKLFEGVSEIEESSFNELKAELIEGVKELSIELKELSKGFSEELENRNKELSGRLKELERKVEEISVKKMLEGKLREIEELILSAGELKE